MRILKNNEIVEKQKSNLIIGELSNLAMVVQAQQVLVDYYSIDADVSERVHGLRNTYDYIAPDSTISFNKIEKVPIAGIDNLSFQNDYNEETGLHVEFEADGVIFPNTVQPKPGDCFKTIIGHGGAPSIMMVTKIRHVVVKDLACVAIEFYLFSQDPAKIIQLEKQVLENYVLTVSSIGADKNIVVKKESYFQLRDHCRSYQELVDQYNSMFYDNSRGLFMYKKVVDPKDKPASIIDLVLLKFMFEEGIIVYDRVITYINSNYEYNVDRIFIDDPYVVDNFMYKTSALYGLISRKTDDGWDKNPYPVYHVENPQISKFTGTSIFTVEKYGPIIEDQHYFAAECNILSVEFLRRIKENDKYDDDTIRNAIISYYHGEEIDFDEVTITDRYSAENFYLIPILLYIYQKHIATLR